MFWLFLLKEVKMDQKFIDEMIKAHNDYRSLHQVEKSVLQSNGHYIIGPYIIIG